MVDQEQVQFYSLIIRSFSYLYDLMPLELTVLEKDEVVAKILFPWTVHIHNIKNWIVDGVRRHYENEEGKNQKYLKRTQLQHQLEPLFHQLISVCLWRESVEERKQIGCDSMMKHGFRNIINNLFRITMISSSCITASTGNCKKLSSIGGGGELDISSSSSVPSSDIKSIPMERVDCMVIGAGVVGMAMARVLASRGREVLVLDSAPTFGTVTSFRSSKVFHTGIYYPPNSLKAVCCITGRELLYKYCLEREIPHKKIDKFIVATRHSEIPKLNDLMSQGIQNGVEGLIMMKGPEAMRMEPELQCVKALWSPVSGAI